MADIRETASHAGIPMTTAVDSTASAEFAGASRSSRSIVRLSSQALPWLLPLISIALWQLAGSLGYLPEGVLPRPSAVVAAAWQLTLTGELPQTFMSAFCALPRAFWWAAASALLSVLPTACRR